MVPARIHVLFARDAPAAVVIRRGPSRHTAVIGWDRRTDRFQLGQWLYGRIYERRCDLSPDGRYLIYFAMNGRWGSKVTAPRRERPTAPRRERPTAPRRERPTAPRRERPKGSWTAISQAPWLKAVALWPKGDCWNGGGLFLSPARYWLNGCHDPNTLAPIRRVKAVEKYPWHETYGGECPGVYYIRLQRDGWAMRYIRPYGTSGHVALFEKRVADHWRLRKLAHASVEHPVGRGCYFDEHRLWNARTEEEVELPSWEWAEVDRDRLVWADAGRMYAGRLGAKGLDGANELFDFNALRFERRVAPY